MTGARYEALAARVTDGPDLPDGPLAVPASTPPGPYSEHAVAAVVADRDARIRELEAEVLRLREVEAAALAFVSAVTAPEVVVITCRYCDHVATMVRFPGGAARCDRHANGGTDLPYAPAWRRLRKAVGR